MTKSAPTIFEIRVKGHLDRYWHGQFHGMAIIHDDVGETRLIGPIADQASLYAILRRIRDLGLPLISLLPVKASDQADSFDS